MKVLGVNGSGRGGGNTAVLVKGVLDGAKEAGAETVFMELADMKIAGCRACKECKRTQRCVLEDDMRRFYRIAPGVDVLVLASPIYLDHITAQLMAFIHRMYCYLGMGLENYYPNKNARAVLGITYGAGGKNSYDYVLDWMEARMKGYFDIPTLAKFKIPSTVHTRIIEPSHPEVQRAYAFGKSLS